MFESFEEWLGQIPQNIQQDRLWEYSIYRKSLYLADLAWFDCEPLLLDSRGKSLAWQLIRAAGSVAANIEEGFGRGFGKIMLDFSGSHLVQRGRRMAGIFAVVTS